ncbi:ABC transporter substrate-binding protein [Thermicanus aegyptius]|uniref:ABC transporter substrate-binding protein n=1 Tax=Thermicanus aegyptius TaxID=94009 RepID=UPI00042396F7|nr:helical backbone metal receptor [Thermicanus aegyptius]
MRKVYDHLERLVEIPENPERIVSLVPSITETLFAFGLEGRIAGRTRYCIAPPEAKEVPVVGGTKDVKAEKILSLRPDLILAEKEETPRELVERLEKEVPLYVADVENFEEGIRLIRDLGEITGKRERAEEILSALEKEYARFREEREGIGRKVFERGKRGQESLTVAYLIWRKPNMAAGSSTFIDAMLRQMGLKNVFAGRQRYPVVSEAELQAAKPDLLFLSSEPYPFSPKHREEFQRMLPDSRIHFVDGAIFSWYGVRMLQAPSYFIRLLSEIVNPL